MSREIRVVVKPVGRSAYSAPTDDGLAALQGLVGGCIEAVYPPSLNGLVLFCNEEGKLDGLPVNCLCREVIGGTLEGQLIIAKEDSEGELTSLSAAESKAAVDWLNERAV